jgi:sugar (pentulose or hexulose) kinase
VTYAAVDLGASSGRVMAGRVGDGGIALHEVHRFPNVPVLAGGTLYWDILRLYGDMLDGLRMAARSFPLVSAAIDSWGVDYGLLDAAGTLIGNPVHYRDQRTAGVTVAMPPDELYAITGIQHMPINTIYQLAATPRLESADTLLMIPDLLAYWLTGVTGAEVTNASTTSLLDVRTRSWATDVMQRAGIPARLFPPLREPGSVIGTGPDGVPVLAVGSHDTASAVVAVPATGRDFAYISSGTWSLVGMELDAPVLTDPRFTNEAGVDGTVRYLHNVMGLWLLQESMRQWPSASLESLLAEAAGLPALRWVIDADDPVFLAAGTAPFQDMPGRIVSWLVSRGSAAPDGPAQIVRCILDSLALAYRRAIIAVQELAGRHVDVVHIVGGGAQNELLCQLTADACGLPVIAGPVEATALGNILIQARAHGTAPADLPGMRALLRSAVTLRRFTPSRFTPGRFTPAPSKAAWEAAAGDLAAG